MNSVKGQREIEVPTTYPCIDDLLNNLCTKNVLNELHSKGYIVFHNVNLSTTQDFYQKTLLTGISAHQDNSKYTVMYVKEGGDRTISIHREYQDTPRKNSTDTMGYETGMVIILYRGDDQNTVFKHSARGFGIKLLVREMEKLP